ncbi:hypothetical protein [Pseudomonas sp. MWU16-30323]|uniref:hypothetical protein n=1 Tax=Pseudomonas sp. MWU16-30323 TaxID=2878094 RepID=UPI001CFBB51F|nr:hypothetical protein [Pseudomonas sp. MWU16-30323]
MKPSQSPRLDKRGENAWGSDGIEPRSGWIEAYRGAEIRLLLSQWAVNGQMRSLMIVLHLVKGRLLQTQPRNDRSKTHQLSIFAEPLQMPATPRRLIY